jgi:hypothetical protein
MEKQDLKGNLWVFFWRGAGVMKNFLSVIEKRKHLR